MAREIVITDKRAGRIWFNVVEGEDVIARGLSSAYDVLMMENPTEIALSSGERLYCQMEVKKTLA